MSQRISLTRIVAINWYGFRQVFDVDDNVLISGAFGTGKSAILDLMQYVLLGEHWRANRAAAGNARGRDLVGYCLGDTNQANKDGGRHFLRRNGVTLIALEFTRPAKGSRKEPERETWGVRLEYSSPDARPKHTYFYIPARLEYGEIAPKGKMLSEDEFKTWIRREAFADFLITERQGDYLKEMATPRHLNFDEVAFHRTFPKAIAFELEERVETFIREFILEENPLDVRDVRAALRAYDDTRKRLEKQEDEAAFLRRIAQQHVIYETNRREEAILHHTTSTLKLLQAEERRERHGAELKRLEDANADDLKSLSKATEEAAQVGKLLDEVRFQIGKDPEAVKIAELASKKEELQAKVQALVEARKSARQQLDDRHFRWMEWLKHGAALPMRGLKEVLVVDDTLLADLRSGTDAERIAALQKLGGTFNELWNAVRDLVRPLQEEIRSSENILRQLAEDLENLSKGQSPGSFPLFQAVRQKFGNRAEQLGRLIEVKPEAERWWPALELFLGRNRWAIVVNDGADYRQALEILRKTPPGREPESLLNPAEVRQLRGGVRENSLFTKVEVAHPIARQYVEHLLGDVLCVETIEELESAEAGRAITPEGIFKQVPLRRRLKPAASVELTLGREGLERMRAAKQKEQNETRAECDALKRRLADVQTWLDNGRKGGLADATLPDRASELPQLPELESQLGRTRETINLLLTPERENRQKQLQDLEHQKTSLDRKVGSLLKAKEEFSLHIKPHLEAIELASQEIRAAKLNVEASRVELSRRFAGVLESELLQRRNTIRSEFPKWGECFSAVADAANQAGQTAVAARELRRSEREKLATSRDDQGNLRHPEYQGEFPADDESNDAWAARLRVLETVELEKSRQLAADRKREWERRLEDNVLNELNRRISDAQNTIRLLDRYLSQPVGKFRYRLSQRRDTAGYGAIWRLLDSGLEPTDPLAAAIQETEVQRAKEQLMKAVDGTERKDGEQDANALRMLDYRNYHHYDLEMVPADKPEAPPISLGRSGRNLSGGEGQAPFFISMLAAFRRVYDRGDRASTRSQQLGLVVSWEDLLEDARLVSATERGEAESDAKALEAAGWIELKPVRYKPHLIDRVLIPLAVEARWREAFGFVVPTDEEAKQIREFAWGPSLAFVREARLNLSFEELRKINDFVINNAGKPLAIVPIKERSLQLFGDEKRLDVLGSSALFRPGRLDLSQHLCCEIIGVPLAWKRGPSAAAAKPVIVIENAATWHSYCRWNAERELFSAVVYGDGNRFVDGIRYLKDLFSELGGTRPVLYFGDLDPQGLLIPQEASARAQAAGLPAVSAELWSYRLLLTLGRDHGQPWEGEPASSTLCDWLGDCAEPARQLFAAGQRLAQERIGWEFLQGFSGLVE